MLAKNANKEYTDYLLSRGKFRKFIRKFYLNNIIRFVEGPTIDFGCGVGELLKLLPQNSLGTEINQETLKFLKSNSLNAVYYNGNDDEFNFSPLRNKGFKSIVMSHVLELIINPESFLRRLLKFASEEKIHRLIIIVPGKLGFQSDSTHVEYINREFFTKNGFDRDLNYKMIYQRYFPVPFESFGRIFPHNELITVFELSSK
jgi:hypothetical protein